MLENIPLTTPQLIALAIIAFVLLAIYFATRPAPKRKLPRHVIDQILVLKGAKEPTPHATHTKTHATTKAVQTPASNTFNHLTQLPIFNKKGKDSKDAKPVATTATESLKEVKVSEGGWTQVTLFENTPERIGGVKVLITLIRQDSDGKMRASLSYYDKLGNENDFRVSQGDVVNINSHPCKVEKITFVENNRGNVKMKIKTQR